MEDESKENAEFRAAYWELCQKHSRFMGYDGCCIATEIFNLDEYHIEDIKYSLESGHYCLIAKE